MLYPYLFAHPIFKELDQVTYSNVDIISGVFSVYKTTKSTVTYMQINTKHRDLILKRLEHLEIFHSEKCTWNTSFSNFS